jgi:Na+-translocating ferredoxin:NAD+ oxidoreductase RnfC subunit
VKLKAACETVIANGAECEPLLESDKYLLRTEPESVVAGLELVMQAAEAREGVIAVKKKAMAGLGTLQNIVSSRNNIRILELDNFYPAGDEQILVYEATGKTVPPLGLPLEAGCLVQNIETLRNIHRAGTAGTPVTRRFLTCTGLVRTPSVVETHIGTSIKEVVSLCGTELNDDMAVLIGGPMMGKVETDFDAPVIKTTSGIIVLPKEHDLVRRKTLSMEVIIKQAKAVCCQCSYCTELCSRYLIGHPLQPHKIMRQIGYGLDVPEEVVKSAFLCSECGLCEIYACVMGISPALVNRILKEKLTSAGYKPDFSVELARSAAVHGSDDASVPHGDFPDWKNLRDFRKIPTSRIINRLGLGDFKHQPVRFGVKTDPERVEILLKQHIGATAELLVKQGDMVKEGDIIGGIPEGSLGARVHASIDGTVMFADKERIVIAKGEGK